MGDSTFQANKHCAHDDPLVASSDHVIVGVEIHYRQNDIYVLGITIVDHDSSMNVFECIHIVNQTVSVVVTACRSVDATPKKLSTPRSACGDEYRGMLAHGARLGQVGVGVESGLKNNFGGLFVKISMLLLCCSSESRKSHLSRRWSRRVPPWDVVNSPLFIVRHYHHGPNHPTPSPPCRGAA